MIEKQLEERMHAALAGEPPLGFDPDEVVDRAARRRRKRRSAITAVGAAGTVLVLAVTVVIATAGRDRRQGPPGTPTAHPGICQRFDAPDRLPPSGFRGSAEVLDRLEKAAPSVIEKHLGVPVVPADQMTAGDCPPTVGAAFWLNGRANSLGLHMVHARPGLDLGHDDYADDTRFRLLAESPQEDGARIRTYEDFGSRYRRLFVLRFGTDGMITEASVSRPDLIREQDLVALVSDPELRFELPR